MTRSRRLKRIVELADLSKQTASQRLSDSRQKFDSNLQRLEEFKQYRREYTDTLGERARTMSGSAAKELRNFISHLDRTIAELEERVRQSDQEFQLDREKWQGETRRSRTLAEVLDRSRRQDAHRDERNQQSESDDRAAAKRDV